MKKRYMALGVYFREGFDLVLGLGGLFWGSKFVMRGKK